MVSKATEPEISKQTHLSTYFPMICATFFLVAVGATMPSKYMPHARCWNWDRSLIWSTVITNGLIFFSYMAISVMVYFFGTRSTVKTPRFMAAAFSAFIFLCGITHLMDIILMFYALFWLDIALRVLTAWASVATAIYTYQVREALYCVLRGEALKKALD